MESAKTPKRENTKTLPTREELLVRQFVGRASCLIPWLMDDEVTDILINGTESVYLERNGTLEPTHSGISEVAVLREIIERLVVPIGRRVDASQPYLDGRLVEGSRFHIILPPVAPMGPLISIRKWRDPLRVSLAHFADPQTIQWLSQQIHARRNILIGGGTGSGKTTLVSRLLDEVARSERVAIIEETMEIRTSHPHVARLEARVANVDGSGEVSLRALVKNALRMRPDRVVLGECRGGEAFDVLQAMNTGHRGSLCTIHGNSAVDSLRRLEGLVLLSGIGLSVQTVRAWIGANIQVVVFLQRDRAERKINDIVQLQGLEGEVYRLMPILERSYGASRPWAK